MSTIRLTASQALIRFLIQQKTIIDGEHVPLFGGIWAIFGHGNVAGIGEALFQAGDDFPTYRAHNEQAMAHAAIAYAKANQRQQMMACTTSIGPGATNMVTAAALAHVNRLPVLFLPGDVFANRRPDPVLQQVENFADATVSANDCFRPVSRYFDRITRPEHLITSLPQAMRALTDPVDCGPVTLALCQDVQAEAYDYPESFFDEKVHTQRRAGVDTDELNRAVDMLMAAEKPLIVAGGGVLYSRASEVLALFSEQHNIPVCETQAGKSSLPWDHANTLGAVGVTGTSAANTIAAEADVVLAIGTRLQDFTTASRSLFANPDCQIIQLNVAAFDAIKHRSSPLVGDAKRGLTDLGKRLGGWNAPKPWIEQARSEMANWNAVADGVCQAGNSALPSDAQVMGAVNRCAGDDDVVVCAAGGLPGEMHKLWRASIPSSYHVEYGFSCMGYEIAGGLGVRMARKSGDVFVLVGDGSYLMLNSEIATSVMLGQKLILVVLDNRGFGCINRLQNATGGAPFNNLLKDARHQTSVDIDFASHAASLGAQSEKTTGIAELEEALTRARAASGTYVIVIDTDPMISTGDGGAWWDVAVPQVSDRESVNSSHSNYVGNTKKQRIDG
jgi:3D-(3,5/4)-trihydroxycyclohexane-1,2-dione acylhydrolase (decyclizing)